MKRKTILAGALAGALLGLEVQFTWDFFTWSSPVGVKKTMFEWLFWNSDEDRARAETLDSWLTFYFGEHGNEREHARQTLLQACFWFWLKERGERLGYTAIASAVLGAFALSHKYRSKQIGPHKHSGP